VTTAFRDIAGVDAVQPDGVAAVNSGSNETSGMARSEEAVSDEAYVLYFQYLKRVSASNVLVTQTGEAKETRRTSRIKMWAHDAEE